MVSEILKLFRGDFREGYGALVCLSFGNRDCRERFIRPLPWSTGLEKMIRNTMMGAALSCCRVVRGLDSAHPVRQAPRLRPRSATRREKVIEGFIARAQARDLPCSVARFYAQLSGFGFSRGQRTRRGG